MDAGVKIRLFKAQKTLQRKSLNQYKRLTAGILACIFLLAEDIGGAPMARLNACAIVAQVVLVSPLVSLSAAEHRVVRMEVLTVEEVEVCPLGYGRASGCGAVDVLRKLSHLRATSHSKEYELDLRSQSDDVRQGAVELELSPGMIWALAPKLHSEPVRDRRFAGLFVFHIDRQFGSIHFQRHERGEPSRENDDDGVHGDRRWYDHHRGEFLLPIKEVTWTVKLDGWTVDFKFVPQRQ